MVEEKYEIWCGNTMLADNMIIDIAIVLLRALFENRYRFEDGLELKIKRKKSSRRERINESNSDSRY